MRGVTDLGTEEKGSLEAGSWHCRQRVGVTTGGILLMIAWEVDHCKDGPLEWGNCCKGKKAWKWGMGNRNEWGAM